MRTFRFTRRFEKAFASLPDEIATLFEKKLPVFLRNIHHPSFRTGKISGTSNPDIWEASLTMNYRITFVIAENEVIIFRNIGTHAILDKKQF